MFKLRPLALASLFLLPSALIAVTPAERLGGESASEDDPDIYDPNYYLGDEDTTAPSSEGDFDLGEQVILRRAAKRAPVKVNADTFLFWSDNVASASTNEQEGWFFGGSLSARWKQRLATDLYLDTYAYQDAYVYDTDGLDFQSSEFGLGLIYNIPALGDLSVYGRYEFLYLHADNPFFGPLDPDENTSSRYHRLRLGVYKSLYRKADHAIAFSGNVRYDVDASSGAQKNQQYTGRLRYSWRATDKLRVHSYYRLSFRDYHGSSREDWNQYVGVDLEYILTPWARAYTSILYGKNESNLSGGASDYDAWQAGVGAGVRISF